MSPRCRRAAGLGVLWLLASCGEGPPAAGPDAPASRGAIRNVIVVSLDTLSALHSSAYGYARPTSPVLERIAAGGVLFENAYTPQVWTLTAHLSLMTGLYPQSHGASEKRAATQATPTLGERLREHGFATASFTGTDGYMDPRFGLGRGFERYEMGAEDAALDNGARLAWLEEQAQRAARDPDHRFFLFAHYFDVHSDVGTEVPYEAPAPVGRRFVGDVLGPGERWSRRGDTQLLIELEKQGDVSERDRAMLAALYDAGALYADQVGLGGLWSTLERLDLLRDTLLVVTSDHGEELFQHGKGSHQQPYEETARVPLVFAGPGVAAGLRPRTLVTLVDVMPTVLSLLGMEIPPTVQGRDLSPILRGEREDLQGAVYVDGLLGGLPDLKWRYPSSITREQDGARWSYVNTVYDRMEDGERVFYFVKKGELYRIDEDPAQERDVRDANPLVVLTLKRELLAWYAANEALARRLDAGTSGEPARAPLLAPDESRALEALGYGR